MNKIKVELRSYGLEIQVESRLDYIISAMTLLSGFFPELTPKELNILANLCSTTDNQTGKLIIDTQRRKQLMEEEGVSKSHLTDYIEKYKEQNLIFDTIQNNVYYVHEFLRLNFTIPDIDYKHLLINFKVKNNE